MGRAGASGRAVFVWVACAVAAALAPAAPRAEVAAPAARRWQLSAITLGLEDAFLGVPRTRLNDDNGFVADLRATVELTDGERRSLRLVASDQLITERGGFRRVDQGRLYVEWERRPPGRRGFTVGWLAGLDLVGNLGGARLQDWAHRTVFTGRVLGGSGRDRLQDTYAGRLEILGMAGGHVSAIQPLTGPVSLRGGVHAAFGAGTGFFGEIHPYVGVGVALGFADLELRAAAGSYWTSIDVLTLPGGYVTRLFGLQPSARLVLRGPRWLPAILGVQLDWNSGNTRQHVGGVTLGARF